MESSDQNENELHKLIQDAFKANNPRKLHGIITMIYDKLNLRKCFLKKVDIERLNKLAHMVDSRETHFAVGVIYNIILSYKLITIEAMESESLLVIVNILYPLYQELEGTILSKRLIIHIRHMLHVLNRRPEISKDDLQEIKNLLESPSIKHQKLFFEYNELPDIKDAKECFQVMSGNHRITGIMKLIQVFEKCSSIEEQLEIFSKKLQPLLKLALTDLNDKSLEILKVTSVMLDHLFFETEFLLKLKKDTFNPKANLIEDIDLFLNFQNNPDSSKDQIVTDDYLKPEDIDIYCYKASESEMAIKSCENIYHVVSFIVNSFINYKSMIDVQRIVLRILKRFYTYFPNYAKQLEEPIMKIMSNIHEDTNPNNKKEAASFLYRLIHRDASPEFKEKLEKNGTFNSLFESSSYCSSVLKKSENMYEAIYLQDLYVKTGFPSNITINAGASYTINLEIWKPYSIIYWAFLLSSHDIDFYLYRINSFEMMAKGESVDPILVHSALKVETQKNIWTKGTYIVKEPGLYKIEFNNMNSWFNSKNLRYSVVVLEPDFKIDEFLPVTLRKKSLEIKETKKSEETKDHKEHKPEVGLATITRTDPTLKGKAIIYLSEEALKFYAYAHGAVAELDLPYSAENLDWKVINASVLEAVKRIIEPGKHSAENQISIQIVYNTGVYKTLFRVQGQESQQGPKDHLNDAFSPLLNQLSSNLTGPITVEREIDFALNKHAHDLNLTYKDNVYFVYIDEDNKKFISKYRKTNLMSKSIDLNLLVAPILSENDARVEPLSKVYFESANDNIQNSILATLIINICAKYENEVTAIDIFFKAGDKAISEESQLNIKKIVETSLINNEDDRILKVPTIIFRSVKISEYIKNI